jgi:hypothetical protein
MVWNFFKKSAPKVKWECEHCDKKFETKKDADTHEKTCKKTSEESNSVKNSVKTSINKLKYSAETKKEKTHIGPEYFKQKAEKVSKKDALFFKKKFDYSVKSLKALDEIINTTWTKDRFKDAKFMGPENIDNLAYTGIVLDFGSYFGEVLIKQLKGKWIQSKELGGWVVNAKNAHINVFHIIQDCFSEPAKCWAVYDRVKRKMK